MTEKKQGDGLCPPSFLRLNDVKVLSCEYTHKSVVRKEASDMYYYMSAQTHYEG